jgi:hypothetical protein
MADTAAIMASSRFTPNGSNAGAAHSHRSSQPIPVRVSRQQWKTRYYRQKPGLTPEEQDEIDAMAWAQDSPVFLWPRLRRRPLLAGERARP